MAETELLYMVEIQNNFLFLKTLKLSYNWNYVRLQSHLPYHTIYLRLVCQNESLRNVKNALLEIEGYLKSMKMHLLLFSS